MLCVLSFPFSGACRSLSLSLLFCFGYATERERKHVLAVPPLVNENEPSFLLADVAFYALLFLALSLPFLVFTCFAITGARWVWGKKLRLRGESAPGKNFLSHLPRFLYHFRAEQWKAECSDGKRNMYFLSVFSCFSSKGQVFSPPPFVFP